MHYECRAAPRRSGAKSGVQGYSVAGNKSRYTKYYYGYWGGRCIRYYKFVKGVEVKAKTVTTLLAEALAKAKLMNFTVRVR